MQKTRNSIWTNKECPFVGRIAPRWTRFHEFDRYFTARREQLSFDGFSSGKVFEDKGIGILAQV